MLQGKLGVDRDYVCCGGIWVIQLHASSAVLDSGIDGL